MLEPYASLAPEIQKRGFFVTSVENMGDWNRITICSQRRTGGGYTGNSFWLTFLADNYYLGTWGGMLYCLPDSSRIVELCVEWLSREPQKTMADFDKELANKYKLIETADDDFDALAGKTIDPT